MGNTGVGKSFLANVLLKQDVFVHKATARAVTTETEFKDTRMGNETYTIFNIPGLIEADQKRIETNKAEIHKAFTKRPTSLILYVFGCQGGRIRNEDVVAFNALHKAYPFNLESLVLIINGVPKDRPKDYEGEVMVSLEELIKVPCTSLCVLGMIDNNNPDERQKLREKLLQVIVDRKPRHHEKKHEIELQRDKLRQAQAEIKELRAVFEKDKKKFRDKIKTMQKKYKDRLAQVRNETDYLRVLVQRQAEEVRKLQYDIREQEAVHRKSIQDQDAKHYQEMRQMQGEYQREIWEVNQRAANQIAPAQQTSKLIWCMYHFLD